jgi:hypothetical protein
MCSDTIYSNTHVCMIGKSHATFVWCLQGTVSHIEIYWCLGGLLFGLDDSFRERVRALMIGLTGVYSERQSYPSLASFVRVQFEKLFLRRRFSLVRTAAHFSEKHATTWNACCYGKVHLLLDVKLSTCASDCALCKIACMRLSLCQNMFRTLQRKVHRVFIMR